MKRFHLNIALLLAGIIIFTGIATWLFTSGRWPQACLILITTITCIAFLIKLQSKLIASMSTFVKALEMNDSSIRVELGGDKELTEMSESINRISDLYGKNMRELQTRKLYYDRVLKIMTHEMRNGITPIAAISSDMLANPGKYADRTLLEASQLIHTQASGIVRFLDSYYNLTHLPEPCMEEVNAGVFFRHLKKVFCSEVERRSMTEISVKYTVAEYMTLTVDTQMMTQVMMNIFRNALDSLPVYNGQVEIVLSISEGRPYISITDNGSGIAPEVMENLFTPFYSTKKEGSGVGLTIARQITRLHGGDIKIRSTVGKGTTVIVSL